jgi:hypothetical protein
MKWKNVMGRWVQRSAWAGASLTVVLGAGIASAAECPQPTLEVCQDEGYLQSTCGQVHAQYCNELIAKAFDAEWATLKEEHVALLPESLGGGLEVTRTQPYAALGSTYQEGGEGSYGGTVLKNQNLYFKRFDKLNESDKLQLEVLEKWKSNGEQINSCQEYVYEKFLGYSTFEDRIGGFGTDYRGVFQAAFGNEGIAYKELYGASGNPLGPVFSGHMVPKNLFFLAEQGPYPEGTQPYQINPELLKLVPVEGRQYYKSSWDWHQQMNEQLQQYHDDELNQLFTQQRDLAALVERRRATWEAYNSQRKVLDAEALKKLGAEVAEQLYGMDKELESRLYEAEKLGCLGLNGDPRCDWSPSRFKTQLDAEMVPRREKDYQDCLAITGNDFGPDSLVRNADKLEIGLKGDYTGNSYRLDEYISIYAKVLLDWDRLVIPWTLETRRSDSRSNSGSFGNSYFGASYEYGAGWEFNATSLSTGACQTFNARIYAYLVANARVFGTTHEVVYGRAEATAGDTQIGYSVQVRVLGSDIYNSSHTYPASFSLAISPNTSREFFRAGAHFVIVAIPVSVSGGVTGGVGLNASLTGGLQTGCKFNLNTNVTPWARLDGFAEAAVDIWFASAGVRGYLTLVRAELPLAVNLAIYLDAYASKLMFQVDANLRFVLRTLDGRVTLFIRAFGSDIAEWEIASFSGLSTDTTLFDQHRTLELARLN